MSADRESLNVLTDSVRRLAAALQPTRTASRERTPPGDAESWTRITESGWLYAGLDEQHGGLGGRTAEITTVLEQVGRALLTQPVLPNFLGLHAIAWGTADTRASGAIAALLAGSRRIAYAGAHRDDRLLRSAADGGWRFGGRRGVVPGADSADDLVIACSGTDPHTPSLLAILPLDTPGVTRSRYTLVDGTGAADVIFDAVELPSTAILATEEAASAIVARLDDLAALGTAADALGAMSSAFDLTLAYLKQRMQFGAPIGANQALQHRLVDMLIAVRETAILVRTAAEAFERDPVERGLAVTAAKIAADHAARLVGEEAVQLHGGIGTTDEALVSHYARRLLATRALGGDTTRHRRRFDDLDAARDDEHASAIHGLDLSDEDQAFADDLRAFVAAHLAVDTATTIACGDHPTKRQVVEWEQALGRHGWLAYTWPKEHGGPGLSVMQKFLFEIITAEMGAPAMNGLGIKMAGPVIQEFGTDAQKAQHLPGIRTGEVQWCQGYSEPNSGSDLASLATRAELRGDHYIVNGQKIWTSFAHWADWMFMLVRTSREATRQAGISFLLVDMKTPGITVRPIMSADGHHNLNEVFFDNVAVPVANLIGEEGKGWTYAKYLLGNERLGIVSLPAVIAGLKLAERAADLLDDDAKPRRADPHFADRLVDLKVRARALQGWVRDALRAVEADEPLGAEVSMMKIRGTTLIQDLRAFVIDAAGVDALPFDFAGARNPPRSGIAAVVDGAMSGYIYQRAFTILGGTTEIQKNIVSKAMLGL